MGTGLCGGERRRGVAQQLPPMQRPLVPAMQQQQQLPPMQRPLLPAMQHQQQLPPMQHPLLPAMQHQQQLPPMQHPLLPAMQHQQQLPPMQHPLLPAMQHQQQLPPMQHPLLTAMQHQQQLPAMQRPLLTAMQSPLLPATHQGGQQNPLLGELQSAIRGAQDKAPGDVAGGLSRHSNGGGDPLPCPYFGCRLKPRGNQNCRACCIEHCPDRGHCSTGKHNKPKPATLTPSSSVYPSAFSLPPQSLLASPYSYPAPTPYPQQLVLGSIPPSGATAAGGAAHHPSPPQYPQQLAGVSSLALFGSPAYHPVWAHTPSAPVSWDMFMSQLKPESQVRRPS